MENASKALLMAGGVFIALMVIGALVLMFNNLTAYQQSKNAEIESQEIIEFNNEYISYARDDVRGNDLISLINKIIDYNKRKSEEGYTQMEISIEGIDTDKLKYDTGSAAKLVKNKYDQNNLDSDLIIPVKALETKYQQKYISMLASNISKVMSNTNTESEKEIKKILKTTDLDQYDGLSKIQDDAQKYYEYQQLKRSYFDIDGSPDYDQKTGRIIKLKFKYTETGV